MAKTKEKAKPADDTAADDTAADDTAADDTAADDTAADDTPADDTPADDTPADDTAADDTPADDTPADDTPAVAPEVCWEVEAISLAAATLVQVGRPGHYVNPAAVLELNVTDGEGTNAVRLAGEASFKPISNEDTAKLLAVCSVITD